ncbi:MAG: Rieske 2Fe-2S domain-containing protein [Actinobacteria bacterium]|jgi:phenylpropionate dioxygenase-like ring-hydroxylating dioxygenase large terminal subunit|uniref:Unannotated protein n=2 Tax=freshwater metagenome TaxID=449393 RepID=A0A6J6A2Z9_9ZZZZ|nr:Rieske 2Fe-2S domain-containing protein [Actinomycetota bacterium]MSW76434.1 Rieske 2Fe-2S domain-containing protein [Actinomycetota bacterium]MSX94437.1 Rieske 2Fe-2S domain-containing protein [Actinomycetota bacterium]MSZ82322.1 Rieske 2Fe-2S domain-containing protein [Actinomycetota bacterium]MTB16499.1 Rieske 2Fe-2S domain-containing protein [Actinomycetota bacterium]
MTNSTTLPTSPVTAVLCGNPAFRDAWYPVARSIELSVDRPHAAMLLGTKIVLYRVDGTAIAAPDRCPHREAPLSKGSIEDGCLVCPYHGWKFGSGGRCVNVPSSGDHVPPPPRAHLSTLLCEERYGLVWVSLGTPRQGIPVIPHDADPSFRRITNPTELWHTSATRMVDNFLDITHFPFVHTGTFGKGQDTRAPSVELQSLDNDWFGYAYDVKANNDTAGGSLATGETAAVVERSMTSGFQLPLACRSTIRYQSGLEHILLLMSTPIDDVTSYFSFVIWRNDDFSVSAEEIVRFDHAIGAEDKRMLEQFDGVLPLDQTTLVSVQADKCNVEWRRRLVEAMRG